MRIRATLVIEITDAAVGDLRHSTRLKTDSELREFMRRTVADQVRLSDWITDLEATVTVRELIE